MSDTDLQRAARRRAHNAHALERCNAMGRTAGSILWQPLQKRDGKWFTPDGATLPEPPIEWRSEKLETILSEMDAREAVAPVADPGKVYVETLDIADWKAAVDAQFSEGAARQSPVRTFVAAEEIEVGQLLKLNGDGTVSPAVPPPSTISLEELERAIIGSTELPPLGDGRMVIVGERSTFATYRRKQIAELRPYLPGEDASWLPGEISVSAEDVKAGSPKPGDMIARNPKNHADQWLVAEQYFKDNFEPIE